MRKKYRAAAATRRNHEQRKPRQWKHTELIRMAAAILHLIGVSIQVAMRWL